MILEIDTSLLDKIPIKLTINQLVLLTLVLNDIKYNYQDIHRLLSLVNEEEILELVQNSLILETKDSQGNRILNATDRLKDLTKEDKTLFDTFYEQFPVYVIRPDGTKGFLRANVNKCRKEYNKIVGRSKAMHEHLLKCLQYEIDSKMSTGRLGYMKTMWKWLTQREWEAIEDQMNDEYIENYTTEIL